MQRNPGSLASERTARIPQDQPAARNKARIYSAVYAGLLLLALCMPSKASTFTFNTDPFAGTNILNVPGRQILGGETFINFNIANDVFVINQSVFGVNGPVNFINGLAQNLPTTGVNVVVLQNLDDDGIAGTPFGASNAANLIASRVTTHGAGFFIYFNQSLDLPRLVFSTDLASTDSDLRILTRMLNLNGQTGRNALPTFSAANFQFDSSVPEPSSLMLSGFAFTAYGFLRLIKRIRS